MKSTRRMKTKTPTKIEAERLRRIIVEHCSQRSGFTICVCDLCARAHRLLSLTTGDIMDR